MDRCQEHDHLRNMTHLLIPCIFMALTPFHVQQETQQHERREYLKQNAKVEVDITRLSLQDAPRRLDFGTLAPDLDPQY